MIRKMELEQLSPMEIEQRSFAIIEEELTAQGICLCPEQAPIIKRCIHTTADFEYAFNLCFSPDALEKAHAAICKGASLVTDTTMALSGINKRALAQFGIQTYNFIADPDIIEKSRETGITRSALCMDKAAQLDTPMIYVIGNAPTALIRIYELYREQKIKPALVIGVPVGFVNVVQSKELIMETDMPYIIAKGRKGGSNVAAAIMNALLYREKRPEV